MLSFTYESLRRKGENDPHDYKLAISLYNPIKTCFTDCEVLLLDNLSSKLLKFLIHYESLDCTH